MELIAALRFWDRAQEESAPAGAGDVPSWLASLLLHAAVVVGIGLLWTAQPPAPPSRAEFSPVEAREPETLPLDLAYDDVPPSDAIGAPDAGGENLIDGAIALGPVASGFAGGLGDAAGEFVAGGALGGMAMDGIATSGPAIDIPVLSSISTGSIINGAAPLSTSVGVGAPGVGGAVDRLTEIILNSLEQRPTLVVWLFDRSFSMQPQRDAINARFDRIYEELGIAEAMRNPAFQHENTPLLTAIVAFGQQVDFLTREPTDDLQAIRSSIASITDDPSGEEATFTAVALAARRYQRYRREEPRRNVLLVVVTDEAGSDLNKMDEAITLCRRNEMPVYVIGVPAPFGRRDGSFKYVDPDPNFDQTPQWLPLDQGPESFLPENVQLGFPRGVGDDLEYIDSGFGPYGLTRLCYESGGVYFAVHPNRDKPGGRSGATPAMSMRLDHSFDPLVMRNYRPDYVSPQEYNRLLQENRARAALVQASQVSMLEPMQNPRLEFPKIDEADLKRNLDVAQQAAAKLAPRIEALYQILKLGEKDRSKLTSPRWQAGYDLAMGRVLALKVRTDGYNIMLAKAKTGLNFQKKESDTWVLEPSDDVTANSQLEKLAREATEYLERVTTLHSGTPWALIAERELSTPMGWKWTEKYTGVVERMQARQNAPPRPPRPMQNMPKPKPKRENVKL